ncbi:MAG: hypothetical protein C0601_03965 [Candidatus Muiribacterium halophilum]|uniref:Uncharacterized protein n=1 Tax=Muiribacterium halophilum TaxID=2053465 RepID=A0A2N5ZJ80_MUIH1|nr:MAG: hypothetical protein C0601_03965 [Candidatus Muirbacterium halophilum]
MPINPVDINTHIAQNMMSSKVKAAEEAKQEGQALFPKVLKEAEEEDKSSVHKVPETENGKVEADKDNEEQEEKRKKKEKEKEEEEKEKLRKMKELFGDAKDNRGSSIDIKL